MLAEGHRVIVFTQYLDTLDFIRERLVARFGDRLACYSGRGGEIWDPVCNGWRIVEKSEENAYHTLKDRIGVFQEVVGPLQPILAEMPRIFRQVARGEMELEEARRQLDAAAAEKPRTAISSFEACVKAEDLTAGSDEHASAPATQERLAGWCLAHPAPGMRIVTIPEPGLEVAARDGRQACLSITWAYAPAELGIDGTEEVLATFDGQLADRHPPTGPSQAEDGSIRRGHEGVRLLTWGDPYLQAWLLAVRGEPLTDADYRTAGMTPGQNPFSHINA